MRSSFHTTICVLEGLLAFEQAFGAASAVMDARRRAQEYLLDEAVATVLERRQGDGRWLLDVRHRNTLHEELAGAVGAPNRWITLRVRRVLDWHPRVRSHP